MTARNGGGPAARPAAGEPPAGEDDATLVLRNAVEPVSEAEARAAVLAQYGLRARVSALRGERDSNFLVEVEGTAGYVLRIANSAEPEVVADFRAAELAHVAERAPALPVPRIQLTREARHTFACPSGSGRRLGQLVTYLPGVPMANAAGAAHHLRQLGEAAAGVTLALAGFDHPGARRPLLWDILQAERARHLQVWVAEPGHGDLVAWALSGFDRVAPQIAGLRRQVIHNDCNPHNVLLSADGKDVVGIIDFGDSVHSLLANDAAVACSYLLGEGPDPLEPLLRFLQAYCGLLPLTGAELRVLPELIATRLALTVLITGWRAGLYPENRAYILRNQPSAIHGLRCLSGLPAGEASERFLAAGLGRAA